MNLLFLFLRYNRYPQLLALMVICIQFLPIQAQNYRPLSQYTTQVWTTDQGLPNTGILDIVQTKDGFIWAGTYGGIVRFDGVNFENYANIFPDRKLIFSVLCEGQDGKLWLGSANGLFFYQDGKFHKIGQEENFSPYVESLMRAKDGKLWVGTRSDGVYTVEHEKITKLDVGEKLNNAFISDIVAGKNDEIWIASPRFGVVQLKNNTTTALTAEEGLTSFYINGLYYENSRNKLWICTADGLFLHEDNQVTKITALQDLDCIHLREHQNYLYISTSLGLYVLNAKGDLVDKFSAGKSPQLVASHFDDEDNIWLAGYRTGLTKFSPKKFQEYNQFNGLDDNAVNAILEVAKDSILLANDAGTVFNITKNGVQEHPITKTTQNQRIRDLFQDRSGNIWVSTYHGIYKFPKGSLTNYEWLYTGNQLTNNSIRFTKEDSQGNYWVGSRTALFQLDSNAKTQKIYTKNENLSSGFIL